MAGRTAGNIPGPAGAGTSYHSSQVIEWYEVDLTGVGHWYVSIA